MYGEAVKAVIEASQNPKLARGGEGMLPGVLTLVDRGMSKVPWWLVLAAGAYAGAWAVRKGWIGRGS